jgi:hypothetical protein
LALRDTLEGAFLDGNVDIATLLEQLTELLAALGIGNLPLDLAAIADQLEVLNSLDADSSAAQVAAPLLAAGARIADLPAVTGVLGPVADTIATVEALLGGTDDLADTLRTSFSPGPDGEPATRRVARTLTGIAALSDSPGPRLVASLVPDLVPDSAGDRVRALVTTGPALAPFLDALRLLMALSDTYQRARGLGEAVASLSDAAAIAAVRAEIAEWDPSATVARITSGDPVAEVVADVRPALDLVRRAETMLAEAIVGSGAVISQMDPEQLRTTWRQADAALASIELGAATDFAAAIRDGLRPLTSVRPGDVPVTTAVFRAEVAALVGQVTEAVGTIEVARFTSGMTAGIAHVTAPMRALADALADVRTAILAAIDAIEQVLAAIDLDVVGDAVRTVTEPVAEAVAVITATLEEASAALGNAATELAKSIQDLTTRLGTVSAALGTAFGAVEQVVDDLDIAGKIGLVRAALDPVATQLAAVDLTQATDATVDGIDKVTLVVDALPLDLLPDSVRTELDVVIQPIKTFDFDTEVTQAFAAKVAEIRDAIDEEALAKVREATAEALAFLAGLDPSEPLAEFEREAFDPALERIRSLDPDLAMAPVREALDSIPDLAGLLTPADEAFDQLLAGYDAVAPSTILAPVREGVDAARARVEGLLQLPAIRQHVADARAASLQAIESLSIQRGLDALMLLAEEALPPPGAVGGAALGQVVLSATGVAGSVDARAFGLVQQWVTERAPLTAVSDAVGEARDALSTARDTVRTLEPAALLGDVRPGWDQVRAAVTALPNGALRRRLRPLMPPDPRDVEAALVAVKGDVDAALTGALTVVSQLAGEELPGVRHGVEGVRIALGPLDELRTWLLEWATHAGVEVEGADLGTSLRAVLAILREELATPAGGVLDAQVRGTVRSAVIETVGALEAGLDEVAALVALLDVGPLIVDLEAIHAAKRADLEQLRPSTQLADLVASVTTLRDTLRAFDPFRDVRPAIDALQAGIDTLEREFRPTTLFAPILSSYTKVVTGLEAVDVDELFGPLLTSVEGLAGEIETGLTDVGTAFAKLQEALPEPVPA